MADDQNPQLPLTPPDDGGGMPPRGPGAANIVPINVEDEMRRSYLDYSMSVIIGRALPDVRDGLKPVHRRILYAMHDMGLLHNRKHVKCAKVVGEGLGKYHPHGDAALYDALVRMAQPFSLRYPLVDGQGNFGSVDGDPPAAYRYTECRMTAIAEEMLADIEKDTVDFVDNFDNTTVEPLVLPTKIPNLLINGSNGIAVGMATNIPPLIVTEIPYQVNKRYLVERIAELVNNKTLDDVADIRDESDREGMRIVVELKRGVESQIILNNLYKHTQMQENFSMIFLAIVNGQPKEMGLIQAIQHFIDHRVEVVRRRTSFLLLRAREREHILEGYRIALDHLDNVIAIIRGSANRGEARDNLVAYFGGKTIEVNVGGKKSDVTIPRNKRPETPFDAKQADAILELQLHRLTRLSIDEILNELKEIREKIGEYEAILGSDKKLRGVIVKELEEIKKNYGDERRTQILDEAAEISLEDLIADEQVAVTVTHTGYLKRTPIATYRSQRRGGSGRIGMRTREEDFVERQIIASTHAYLLVFTNTGRVYWLKVYEIPDVGSAGKGKAIT